VVSSIFVKSGLFIEREKVQPQITVTQASAKANAVRAEAQANADATRPNGEAQASNIRITGDAEAAAIQARAKALGTNPNLLTLVQAERWNGVLPTTMCRARRCRSRRSNSGRPRRQ
jgi:regulator of protease activity HflC (stomatin/prohibitin superfamily)